MIETFPDKIFLVGFMGCGKSSVGKKLARLLRFGFIDMDVEIEHQIGKSVMKIFEQEGEAFFRKKEREVLLNLSKCKNIVVATGGGVPCVSDNMMIMNKTGITIYLSASPNLLAQRISSGKKCRPLLKDLQEEKLKQTISEMLSLRERYYRQAQITIETVNITAQKIHAEILNYNFKLDFLS